MPHLFYHPGLSLGESSLDEIESRHALKVLRLGIGDTFDATDGKGSFYNCRITGSAHTVCTFEVTQKNTLPGKSYRVHLGITPTKNIDRMEWLVEKATEIGVDEVSFMHTRHSERERVNMNRLEKIAVAAMKQSYRPWLPLLSDMRPMGELLKDATGQKFIAHVDPRNPVHLKNAARQGGKYLILVGPEGDFTDDELDAAIKNGFTKVSLGHHRLRTETAGLVACHVLNLLNE